MHPPALLPPNNLEEDVMIYQEAVEWLMGQRSMTNIIPQEPFETWQVRIAEADAAMTKQAYWIARAHEENIITEAAE